MKVHNLLHTFVRSTILALLLGAASQAATAELVKVRLAQLYQIHGAHMFDPLFPERARKYGLDVQVVPMRRYSDVQLALATGQVEFGALGFINIATMADNNVRNVKIIAGNSVGGQGIILRKGLNSKVKTWKDLEGLKLGVAPNGAAHNLFRSLVKSKGVDLGKIEQVNFTGMGPEAVRALQTGDVDGLVTWEPTNARAVVGGIAEYSTLKLEESESGNINGAFAVSTDFVKKNPDATLNMVKALVEATDHFNADQEAWARMGAAKTGVDTQIVKTAMDNIKLDYRMPAKKIGALLDIVAEFAGTKGKYQDAIQHYVDYSFLVKATGKPEQELAR